MGQERVFQVVNGDIDVEVASSNWGVNYAPGAVFSVTYAVDGLDRVFYVNLGGVEERLVYSTAANIGLNEAAYNPPAILDSELRRRSPADRAAA